MDLSSALKCQAVLLAVGVRIPVAVLCRGVFVLRLSSTKEKSGLMTLLILIPLSLLIPSTLSPTIIATQSSHPPSSHSYLRRLPQPIHHRSRNVIAASIINTLNINHFNASLIQLPKR
jgi:hypothetical protein